MKLKNSIVQEFFNKVDNEDFSLAIQLLVEKHLAKDAISEFNDIDSLLNLFEFESIPDNWDSSMNFVEYLSAQIQPNIVNTGSPYFIGHMTSLLPNFVRPISKYITATNQNMVKVETSKVVTLYERKSIAMLHELIYENSNSFYDKHIHNSNSTLGIITSGGTIANLTALQCARNKILNTDESDIEELGLMQVMLKKRKTRLVVLCSEFAHYSIKKAMGILGLGTANILTVETDIKNKICVSSLEDKLEYCRRENIAVCALIGIAGSTECGVIDPLNKMADLAEKYNVYFHVDAAWAGAVLFSNRYKKMLFGIDRADSVTIDGHKQLYLPMGIGMVLFRDPNIASVIKRSSEYIIRKESFDLGKIAIEGSRAANVFYLQAGLNLLGKKGYEELIDYGIGIAKKMEDIIVNSNEFELLVSPETNILLYRYLPKKFRYSKEYNTKINQQISDFNIALQKKQFNKGKSFVSRTSLIIQSYGTKPICALRVVLANPLTTEKIIREILNEQIQLASLLEKEKVFVL